MPPWSPRRREGLVATHLPLFLAAEEGPLGTLYGHLARANPQARLPPTGEALAIFLGPDAYVSPSFYPSKREHGRVVPTWNDVAVHADGPAEIFDDPARRRDVVARLTELHEQDRPEPWSIDDAPDEFIRAQLKGIVWLRLPIARLEGKRKMSQNRPEADRLGARAGAEGRTGRGAARSGSPVGDRPPARAAGRAAVRR